MDSWKTKFLKGAKNISSMFDKDDLNSQMSEMKKEQRHSVAGVPQSGTSPGSAGLQTSSNSLKSSPPGSSGNVDSSSSSSTLPSTSPTHPKHPPEAPPRTPRGFKVELEEVLIDSPMVREKERRLEYQVDQLGATLRKVLKISKQYQVAGNAFRQVSFQFASELQNMDFSDMLSEKEDETVLQSLQETAKCLSQAILDINDYQNMLMVQMSNVFSVPMESFIRDEYRELKELNKQYGKSRLKFDNSLSKFCHIKKTDVEKIPEAEQELFISRREYQLTSLDYVHKLNYVRNEAKAEFLERTCAFLYAEKAYFNQGYSLHGTIEPQLAILSKHIRANRSHLGVEKDKLNDLKQQVTSNIEKGGPMSTTAVETTGYLFLRVGSKWKRQYMAIKDGKIIRYKRSKETKRLQAIPLANLLIFTVRPARDVERRFCFEVVSPQDSFMLQAENDEILQHWMAVIQNAIANQLNNNAVVGIKSSLDQQASGNMGVFNELRTLEANKFCCDCGSEDPEWASISLGIVFCIECSGIHRQLGTHISKVRSTKLDAWDKETKRMMLCIGNEVANAVFLGSLPSSVSPIAPNVERRIREQWIREKYAERKYVRRIPLGSDTLEQHLHDAVQQGDIHEVLACIANGVDVNWKNPDEQGMAALHHAVVTDNVPMMELLIQNGADVNAANDSLWTSLHYCAQYNNFECAVLLVRRGAKISTKDIQQNTPLDVAISKEHAHCVTLYRLALHAEAEHTGSAIEDESFARALKEFSDEVEDIIKPPPTISTSALWTEEEETDSDDDIEFKSVPTWTAPGNDQSKSPKPPPRQILIGRNQ